MSDESRGKLTTQEAARRLGVKPATLYAYVSRGLITRERSRDGRGSLFRTADVEALAVRGGRAPAATDPEPPAIRTGLTLMEGDRLYFRGRDAAGLAERHTYEWVAEWLWSGREPDEGTQSVFAASAASLRAARAAAAALPERARVTDRFRAAVTAVAVADPLGHDLRPDGVLTTARGLVPAMVRAAPRLDGADEAGDAPIAALLWPRLARTSATPAALHALQQALVLLADHDIAASTYAARVAASARAHPYAVVAAGLAALDGPMHGGAGALARRLITDALDGGDPAGAIAARLRDDGRLPGFGHLIYRQRDPRAEVLLRAAGELPDPDGVRETARTLSTLAAERLGTFPNVDFALALLARLCDLRPDAEEAVFAVARTTGWIAHALEEYQAPPVRHRPRGRYTGPQPGGG